MYGSCIFNCLRNIHLFSIVAAAVYIPTKCTRVPLSPHPHQHLLFVFFLMIVISDRCEVVSYCGFSLHFSDDWWYWSSSFHVPFDYLYIFFGKTSIQMLCPLLIGLFGKGFDVVIWVLCIFFNINPLLDISYADILSHSVGELSILLKISFALKKPFHLM